MAEVEGPILKNGIYINPDNELFKFVTVEGSKISWEWIVDNHGKEISHFDLKKGEFGPIENEEVVQSTGKTKYDLSLAQIEGFDLYGILGADGDSFLAEVYQKRPVKYIWVTQDDFQAFKAKANLHPWKDGYYKVQLSAN